MAGSTPIYGFPYPQSTDLVADYPTLGQELATDVETVISGLDSGLNIVTPTSIANSGGSASISGGAVTFSGVSSLSLNGVFSSTAANYRVIISNSVSSADTDYYFRFRASGVDNSSAYARQYLGASSSTVTASRATSQSQYHFAQIFTVHPQATYLEISQPYVAQYSAMQSFGISSNSPAFYSFTGIHNSATQFDGFTIYPVTGTVSGTVRVYSYQN